MSEHRRRCLHCGEGFVVQGKLHRLYCCDAHRRAALARRKVFSGEGERRKRELAATWGRRFK